MRSLLLLSAVLFLGACGGADVFTLEMGDCFNDSGDGVEVSSVEIVDCSEPHDFELYSDAVYPDDGLFPGDDTLFDYGVDPCLDAFDRFVGIAYEESELDVRVLYPSPESWDDGDRVIQCLIYPLDETKVTGSLANTFR